MRKKTDCLDEERKLAQLWRDRAKLEAWEEAIEDLLSVTEPKQGGSDGV